MAEIYANLFHNDCIHANKASTLEGSMDIKPPCDATAMEN